MPSKPYKNQRFTTCLNLQNFTCKNQSVFFFCYMLISSEFGQNFQEHWINEIELIKPCWCPFSYVLVYFRNRTKHKFVSIIIQQKKTSCFNRMNFLKNLLFAFWFQRRNSCMKDREYIVMFYIVFDFSNSLLIPRDVLSWLH